MVKLPIPRKAVALLPWIALIASRPAVPQELPQLAAAQSGLDMLWQRSVDPLLTLALSPRGGYLALITAGGRLVLWRAQTGKSLWSIGGITAHDAVVSDSSGTVLVYDDMNRLDRRVSLYQAALPKPQPRPAARASSPAPAAPQTPAAKIAAASVPKPKPNPSAQPRRIFQRVLDGAVWTAAIGPDGSYAACVTGNRKLHLISLKQPPSLATVSLDGIGNDLEFAADGSVVAVGLWDESGVEAVDMAGRIRWSYLGAISRRYDVAASPDPGSSRVLSISYKNPNRSDPVLTLLGDQASALWTYPLGSDVYGADARLAGGAGITYVSYTAIVGNRRQIALERRLLALGPSGNFLWRRGGLFFKPTLLFVTPDNKGVVVYDGGEHLYRIDQRGAIVNRDTLPGQLEYWAADRSRTRLIVYTSDGQLTAYKVK